MKERLYVALHPALDTILCTLILEKQELKALNDDVSKSWEPFSLTITFSWEISSMTVASITIYLLLIFRSVFCTHLAFVIQTQHTQMPAGHNYLDVPLTSQFQHIESCS